MSNKVYDVLKFVAQIVLPASATLYITLAGIWNLPFSEQVGGTVMAVDTFLGAVLAISNNKYKKTENTQTKNGETTNIDTEDNRENVKLENNKIKDSTTENITVENTNID